MKTVEGGNKRLYLSLEQNLKDWVKLKVLQSDRPTLNVALARDIKRKTLQNLLDQQPPVLTETAIKLAKSIMADEVEVDVETASICGGMLQLDLDEKNAMGVTNKTLEDEGGWLNFESLEVIKLVKTVQH